MKQDWKEHDDPMSDPFTVKNDGLAKMAGGEVERVDGLAEAICFFEDCTNDLPQQEADYMHSLLDAARIQLKRQEG